MATDEEIERNSNEFLDIETGVWLFGILTGFVGGMTVLSVLVLWRLILSLICFLFGGCG